MTSTLALEVTKSSCIEFDLIYRDDAGEVEDVSADAFEVIEDQPSGAFTGLTFTPGLVEDTDGSIVQGVTCHLDERRPETLDMGKTNFLRIGRTPPGGCLDDSMKIWVSVL